MTTHKTTTEQDLDWLAFCYVTSELSAADLAAFEERLLVDEAACEAVARVMETNLVVAAALVQSSGVKVESCEPPTLRQVGAAESPSRWTGTALTCLAAAAIAATMVIAVGSSALNGSKVAKRDGTDRLVAAWAQGESVRNQADDDSDALDQSNDDLDPPDWMLAAVTAEEQAELLPGEDTPEVREN